MLRNTRSENEKTESIRAESTSDDERILAAVNLNRVLILLIPEVQSVQTFRTRRILLSFSLSFSVRIVAISVIRSRFGAHARCD